MHVIDISGGQPTPHNSRSRPQVAFQGAKKKHDDHTLSLRNGI